MGELQRVRHHGSVHRSRHSLSAPYIRWVDTIGNFIKSIDKKHLYEDNSAFFISTRAPGREDAGYRTSEYYPHWDAVFNMGNKTTAQTFSQHAAMITGKGKVYVVTNSAGTTPTGYAGRS